MAKKKLKVKAATPVGKAMAAILPPKVADVVALEDAVREGSVDGVHDMRIATKRLREATKLFLPAFGRKRMKRHLGHLEQLNDALGAVRDADVLTLEVQELAQEDAALAPGLAPLLAQLDERRDEAGRRLGGVLDETLRFLAGDFDELLHDKPRKREDVWDMPFVLLGCTEISERTEAAFSLEQAAREPDAPAEFHRMRIAIKKVKYALELFLGVIGKPARRTYKPVSDLQELMGKVHDQDVLLETITAARECVITGEVADRASELAAAQRATLHADTLASLDRIHERKLVKRLLKATCNADRRGR